jgi:hypothetical protein
MNVAYPDLEFLFILAVCAYFFIRCILYCVVRPILLLVAKILLRFGK